MSKTMFLLASLSAASACSGQASDKLPPFPAIVKGTLDYATCVARSARALATQSGSAETLARQAVDNCRILRAEALALKGVPVIFPTVAEYDATHLDFARQTVEQSRAKR